MDCFARPEPATTAHDRAGERREVASAEQPQRQSRWNARAFLKAEREAELRIRAQIRAEARRAGDEAA